MNISVKINSSLLRAANSNNVNCAESCSSQQCGTGCAIPDEGCKIGKCDDDC
jgi:hypothetical protein